MTYEQYAAKMANLITTMLTYDTNQVGSAIYAEKCAELEDAHPGFAARFDEELESNEFAKS